MQYTTFEKFADRFLSFDTIKSIRELDVEDLCSLCPQKGQLKKIEEANRSQLSSEVPGRVVDDDTAIGLILYGEYITSGDKKSPRDICKSLKDRCNLNADYAGAPGSLRIMLAQSCHEIYSGLHLSGPQDAAFALLDGSRLLSDIDNDLDPDGKVYIIAPIVPVVSVFSVYILTLVNLVLKRFMQRVAGIQYVWNNITYANIKNEILKEHFSFAPSWKRKEYYYISEQKFLSFANLLLLSSSWNSQEISSQQRLRMLTQGTVLTDPLSSINQELCRDMLIRRVEKAALHKKLVVGSLGDYLKRSKQKEDKQGDLIALYAAMIAEWQEKKSNKDYLFFIGRLPDLVLTDDILEDNEKENVSLLAYLPFPFEKKIRPAWPFYLTWYSPYVYKQDAGEGLSNIRKEYIRSLLASILSELDLYFLRNVALDNLPFEEVVSLITESVFQRLEDQIDRQLEYII